MTAAIPNFVHWLIVQGGEGFRLIPESWSISTGQEPPVESLHKDMADAFQTGLAYCGIIEGGWTFRSPEVDAY